MTNLVCYSMLFALFLQFTFGAINFSSINRSFLNINRGLFESSVVYIDELGNPIKPYFDENTLETYLVNYANNNFSKYSNDYHLTILYLSADGDEYCFDGMCEKVNVKLTAKINSFFNYQKSKTYYISERGNVL